MPPSSEQSFRANLSQFRWARGVTDDSQQTQQSLPSSNPFSRFYNAVAGDYIPLRSDERSNEDEAWFALSRWERLLGFGACLLGAAVCFFVAFITLPMLPINPAKFALSFSLGSLLVMFGFSVLIGPLNHAKHLISKERLPFTLVYFSSLGLTLYFSISVQSYLGSLLAGIVQVVSLVAYVLAYFPGGTQTLRFGGQVALRGAGSLLPF
ncbi:Got1/Sft2-like family-domain-containing protein [Suillus clintonianus]|uniref:Got1/Sft2-like family-domain-containing protein n=1 Tax=Suillus clintonianus TaxID=1904413 RepID=UPI001B86437B|nr:Got1/Sft2-like family-domain-containing protein [Suillus clintonianus]KAG2152831.1 Got1/Sft2-like family-domain-containing protein [Suillus clintonianus]